MLGLADLKDVEYLRIGKHLEWEVDQLLNSWHVIVTDNPSLAKDLLIELQGYLIAQGE